MNYMVSIKENNYPNQGGTHTLIGIYKYRQTAEFIVSKLNLDKNLITIDETEHPVTTECADFNLIKNNN